MNADLKMEAAFFHKSEEQEQTFAMDRDTFSLSPKWRLQPLCLLSLLEYT